MAINGAIPASQMAQRQGLWLWPSTAAKFDAMNADLVAHGYPAMVISKPYGAYRSLADQVAVKKIYGAGAATPGYSNHGLARAWDIYNISTYPAGVIAAYAKKHGLLIDAGNGAGGIESWHMHDADGITPASTTSTPLGADMALDQGDKDFINLALSYVVKQLAGTDEYAGDPLTIKAVRNDIGYRDGALAAIKAAIPTAGATVDLAPILAALKSLPADTVAAIKTAL